MKTRNFIICLSFFVSVTASAQTKYGLEFIGGMNYGMGIDNPNRAPYGITGGIGVILNAGREVEIVGNTLFTYFPPPDNPGRVYYFIPYPYRIYPPDRKAYSCEIMIGPRFNGHGSTVVHPFLVVQGGMQLLRFVEQTGIVALEGRTTSQFLNIHGTEDVQLRGVINIGGGVQFVPSQSVRLNLQATYWLMIGKESSVDSFVPVTLSVLLPV